jgi:hypothetical protein
LFSLNAPSSSPSSVDNALVDSFPKEILIEKLSLSAIGNSSASSRLQAVVIKNIEAMIAINICIFLFIS